MTFVHFLGIDISKDSFDVVSHEHPTAGRTFSNDAAGHQSFLETYCGIFPETLVVLEATGGYETALIAFLLAHKASVHRASPLTASHYTRSLRLHAKTDRLDALALARYAAERHAELRLYQPSSAQQDRLQVLVARRSDLVAMRTAEINRLQHPRYREVRGFVETLLRAITEQIKTIETEIDTLITQTASLKAKVTVMTGVKGVGAQTAHTLLSHLPELGNLTRRQVASLAGCAPHPKDSGAYRGYRATRGGRTHVKRALFMAAMAARRFNPNLRAFYERLIENGKKPIVAITAIMRKIITILNAKIRDAQIA